VAWNDTADYLVGDMVVDDDIAYLATTDNTNDQPPSANWTKVGGGSGVWLGDTPPADKETYPVWFKTDTGKTWTWYTDGDDDSQWIQDVAEQEGQTGVAEALPIGAFIDWGGNTPPAGYLLCDGSEVAELDYPDLFAAIGNNWDNTGGAANPAAGNFRLPPSEIGGLGVFKRGKGGSTVVGEYQEDVFKEHLHEMKGSSSGATFYWTPTQATTGSASSVSPVASADQIVAADMGDPTETRPRSITSLLCIKANYSSYTGDLQAVPVNSVAEPQLEVASLQAAGLLPTAWVLFNGEDAHPITPIASYNIDLVAKGTTGQYIPNFVVGTMDNINYTAIAAIRAGATANIIVEDPAVVRTVNDVQFIAFNSSGEGVGDVPLVSIQFFGGKN